MQPPTTLDRVLRRGSARGTGTERYYHALAWAPGEPRILRDDLVPGGARVPAGVGDPSSLVFFAHFADAQIVDVQSPGRFEFFEMLNGKPGCNLFYPAARPQETLAPHALSAFVRTLNRLRESPDTGSPLAVAISAGDNVDNAQLNELGWFVALVGGGEVDCRSRGAPYEGVQDPTWDDRTHWHPDAAPDRYRELWGFPDCPGLLAEALRPFSAEALALPWLSCFGNHDGLILGNSLPTLAYRDLVVGDRKPVALPPKFDAVEHAAEFHAAPERFLGGPARHVAADAARRIVGRREFVEAHLNAPGRPAGHGYSSASLREGTTYCVHDIDSGRVPIRFVLLDTTNMDGFYEGSIGRRQLSWLEERLAEVSHRHLDAGGRWVEQSEVCDHLIVLLSHHPLEDLVNACVDQRGLEEDQPRALAAEVEALLHRFPNVVLWLNGHRHVNHVWPRPDPTARTAGFWEVSTAAIADWPCQARLLELVANGDDSLSILSTMVDADVPADPGEAAGLARLAAVHRELAANDPFSGLESFREGGPKDRNVVLPVPAPFSIP